MMVSRVFLCGLLLLVTSTLSSAQPEMVVIRPVEIHDVLANPGMGIQTFQRFDGTVPIPPNLAPGSYRLQLALLDPGTRRPAMRLAIQGRQADGWYDLGQLQVEAPK